MEMDTYTISNSNGRNVPTIPQPGEVIQPLVGEGSVEEIAKRRYGLTVTEMTEISSYNDRNYHILVDSQHSSPTIQNLDAAGYVVRIYNNKYSLNIEGIAAQHEAMAHLRKHNIPAPKPIPNMNGDFYEVEEIYPDKEKKGAPSKHVVDMKKYIPGRHLDEVPYTIDLLVKTGLFVANITQAFQSFENTYFKSLDIKRTLWSLTNLPLLKNYTFCLGEEEKSLVEDIISTYNTRVVTKCQQLQKGYIHCDMHDKNILVTKNPANGEYDICGVLDFPDVEYSYPVIDLAVTLLSMTINSKIVDQLDAPGYVLAGYLSVRTLTQEEWDVLVPCVAGRLAQSLTFRVYRRTLEPDSDKPFVTAPKALPLLKRIWYESESTLLSKWRDIASSFKAKQK